MKATESPRDHQKTIEGCEEEKFIECPEGCLLDPKEPITFWAKAEVSTHQTFDSFGDSPHMDDRHVEIEHNEDPEARCPKCGEYYPYDHFDVTWEVQ